MQYQRRWFRKNRPLFAILGNWKCAVRAQSRLESRKGGEWVLQRKMEEGALLYNNPPCRDFSLSRAGTIAQRSVILHEGGFVVIFLAGLTTMSHLHWAPDLTLSFFRVIYTQNHRPYKWKVCPVDVKLDC